MYPSHTAAANVGVQHLLLQLRLSTFNRNTELEMFVPDYTSGLWREENISLQQDFLVILLKNKNIRIQPDTIKKLHAVIHQRFFLSNWCGRRGCLERPKRRYCIVLFIFLETRRPPLCSCFLKLERAYTHTKSTEGCLHVRLKCRITASANEQQNIWKWLK